MTNIIPSHIECSAKVLKELGIPNQKVGYGSFEVDPFFCWYAHLFYLQGKKSLLFLNSLTRYAVVALDQPRSEIRLINAVLGDNLQCILNREKVPADVIKKYVEHLYQPEITKSKNRSVIGTAVDFEFQLKCILENSCPSELKTQADLSIELSRTPINKLPEHFPHDFMRKELLKRYGQTGEFAHDPWQKPEETLH